MNQVVLERALKTKFTDFEDAVIHEAALLAGAQYIVTRNLVDFKTSELPVFEPGELISIMQSLDEKD